MAKKKRTKDGRKRRLIRFHIDVSRGDDAELQETFVDWKSQRKFLPNLRNALWLFIGLMNGDWSMLAMLFPGIVENIQQEARTDLEKTIIGMEVERDALRHMLAQQEDRIAGLEQELERVRKSESIQQIEELYQRLDQKLDAITRNETVQNQPQNRPKSSDSIPAGLVQPEGQTIALQPVSGGATVMKVPQFEVPLYDEDDDIELVAVYDENAGAIAAQNFVDSLMRLQT